MKKLLFLVVVAALAYFLVQRQDVSLPSPSVSWIRPAEDPIQKAYRNKQSNVQVHGKGRVVKVLTEDLEGSKHQRFVLRLNTGQTVLVAHNIDLADRVDNLKEGDTVEFYGEYEWNSRGGVIHWTHHDPGRRHEGGWLKHGGRTYQ